jgi:hypothetical protein
VSDAFNGGDPVSQGTICWDTPVKTISYDRTITVPANNCQAYSNTASSSLTNSDTATVTVCGPVKTGGLTIGFWQNKNGQDIINTCNPGASNGLQAFLMQYNPFKDAPATCKLLQGYVSNIIKLASASGASMNAMLRAQMLATALNAYYSGDPAWGPNKINAPVPVGGQLIDLTQICKNIASCNGSYENTSAAFGGASSLTVYQLLAWAGNQCSAPNCATNNWYVIGSAQSKPRQELAKDTFDAINNQKAFAP